MKTGSPASRKGRAAAGVVDDQRGVDLADHLTGVGHAVRNRVGRAEALDTLQVVAPDVGDASAVDDRWMLAIPVEDAGEGVGVRGVDADESEIQHEGRSFQAYGRVRSPDRANGTPRCQ